MVDKNLYPDQKVFGLDWKCAGVDKETYWYQATIGGHQLHVAWDGEVFWFTHPFMDTRVNPKNSKNALHCETLYDAIQYAFRDCCSEVNYLHSLFAEAIDGSLTEPPKPATAESEALGLVKAIAESDDWRTFADLKAAYNARLQQARDLLFKHKIWK